MITKRASRFEESPLFQLTLKLVDSFECQMRADLNMKTLEESCLSDFLKKTHISLFESYLEENKDVVSEVMNFRSFFPIFGVGAQANNKGKKDPRFKRLYKIVESLVDRNLMNFLTCCSETNEIDFLLGLKEEEKFMLNHIGVFYLIVRDNVDPNELKNFIAIHFHNEDDEKKKELQIKLQRKVLGAELFSFVKLVYSISVNRPEALLEYLGRFNENDSDDKLDKNTVIMLTSVYFWFIALRFPAEYSRDHDPNRKHASRLLCAFPLLMIKLIMNLGGAEVIESLLKNINNEKKPSSIAEVLMALRELKNFNEDCDSAIIAIRKNIESAFDFLHTYPEYLTGECSEGNATDLFDAILDDLSEPKENLERWMESTMKIIDSAKGIKFNDILKFAFSKLFSRAQDDPGIDILINFFSLLNNFQENDDFEDESAIAEQFSKIFTGVSDNSNKMLELTENLILLVSLRQRMRSDENIFKKLEKIFDKIAKTFFDGTSREYISLILKILGLTIMGEKTDNYDDLFFAILNFILQKVLGQSGPVIDENFKAVVVNITKITIALKETFSASKQLGKEEKRKKLFDILETIGEVLFEKGSGKKGFFSSLMSFIKGDIEKVGPELFILLSIPASKQEFIKETLIALREIIKGPQQFLNNQLGGLSKKVLGSNLQSLKDIMKKAGGNEEMSMEDLFSLVDTDHSGRINYQEFRTLSKRLGMNLSEHRIKEIFTSVKMEMEENTAASEINAKEFEVSMKYLQDKSVFLALETLGITKEVLTLLLIWLTLMLLVIFAFIFVGVEAFAIAGTFGAIVNSIFPIGIWI